MKLLLAPRNRLIFFVEGVFAQLWQVGLPKLHKSLCLCYYKYRNGASDRRLPLKLLVMKNNRQFARLGGYFLWLNKKHGESRAKFVK